jgi:hypothetical protein
MPQRTYLGNEFSDHSGRQTRDPPVADDRSASRVPHHAAMIADPELDVSPPTVHELVMNQKLIAGYAAYTDAEELSADALHNAPATLEVVTATVASFVASAKTYDIGC